MNTPGIVDDGARNQAGINRLASGAMDFGCATLQGFYFAGDRGRTWIPHCLDTAGGLFGFGGAVVTYGTDPSNTDAYAFGIDANSSGRNAAIVMQRTPDNGSTWDAAAVAVTATFPKGSIDMPSVAVDSSSTSPMFSRMYLSMTELDAAGHRTRIAVAHSSDKGMTWSTSFPGPVEKAPAVDQFTDLAVAPNGTVYVSWLHCTASGATEDCGGQTATAEISRSTDGGATWSPPVTMQTVVLPPDTCGDFWGTLPGTCEPLTDVPAIATSSGGDGMFVSHDATNFDGTSVQVRVSHSHDGGNTWTPPRTMTPASNHDNQFLPSLSVGPQGTILASWLREKRDMTRDTRPAMAVSKDGGATWRVFLSIATATSDLENDGFGGHFIGDTTGNAVDGGYCLVAWPDTRTGNAVDELGFVSNDAINMCI